MKQPSLDFLQLYQVSLRLHLEQGNKLNAALIEKLSSQCRASKLPTQEFAQFHEHILVMDFLPGCPVKKQPTLIRSAGNFFAMIITAPESGKDGTQNADRMVKTIKSLSGRTVELAASNQQLALEIGRRKKVETVLRKSQRDALKALEKSNALKEQMREVSRQIISAQEKERRKISHELHDVIAQSLAGINVRLATLKIEAGINTKRLARNISQTQKMVTKSAAIVYQFARELRPAALDHVGLIPALHSFMKTFTTQTGVLTHLLVFEGVEKLTATKRTVIFRVVQEALTNVGRHARASRVEVSIRKNTKYVCVEVIDDGQSFNVHEVPLARGPKRLGILGMRERVEMIGGAFEIESESGKGTKITASIPISKATERRWQNGTVETLSKTP